MDKPFERLTMVDAIKKYAGVDFDEITDHWKRQRQLADENGIRI
ncbi:MAG: hypothetical protein ACLUD2_05060 [Clostridium sp.]